MPAIGKDCRAGMGNGKKTPLFDSRTRAQPGYIAGFSKHQHWIHFGLRIRDALRQATVLRQWIKTSTLDCSLPGATSIDLASVSIGTRRANRRSDNSIWLR